MDVSEFKTWRAFPAVSQPWRMARTGEMSVGRGAGNPLNVRLAGCVMLQMFARMVADIGGLDLVGYPHLRIGTWKGVDLSEKVVEN
jgi:hypothetical protein